MHVEAVRTAVDLRRAKADERDQRFFEAGAAEIGGKTEQRLDRARGDLGSMASSFLLPTVAGLDERQMRTR